MTTIHDPQTFMDAYEMALATQEWRQVAPLVHEQCVVTFSTGTHVGKRQVAAAFSRNFRLIENETYAIGDLVWAIRTDKVAVCVYRFRWSGIIDGREVGGSGRGTSTLLNPGAGWQLIAEHLGPEAV